MSDSLIEEGTAAQRDIKATLRARRVERMRQGQQACEITSLPSDNEIRVAIVPLLEKEYDMCMLAVAAMNVPDNVAGAGILDRHEKLEVLIRSIRNPNNLMERIFDNVEELMELVEPPDVNTLYDDYVEMASNISPHVVELGEDEIDFLKQLFGTLQLKGLSGKQLYALRRFISTLSPMQLTDNLLGSS